METTDITPIIETAIHQNILIDGMTWENVAKTYSLTVEEVREIFLRANAAVQARQGSNAEGWRYLITQALLDAANDAQEAFEKSKKGKVKKKYKEGVEVERVVESSCGNPQFLSTRITALSTMAQINIPKEFNVNSKSTHEFVANFDDMSDEELERLASLARLEQENVLVAKPADFRVIEDRSNDVESVVPEPRHGAEADPFCVGDSGVHDSERRGPNHAEVARVGQNELPSE